MFDYSSYLPEDFAADPSFANWVLKRNLDDILFWETWIVQHADRLEVVEQAKVIVLGVHLLFVDQSGSATLAFDKERLLNRVTGLPSESATNTVDNPLRSLWPSRWLTWSVGAAAALLILVAGFAFWGLPWPTAPAKQPARIHSFVDITNSATHPQTILLSDGSVVTLQPKSRLIYPRVFAPDHRQVKLVGEAFFDVARNPANPFFVYTKQAITKVLGTSFRVRAFARESTVNVVVRTGKVAVYATSERPSTLATASRVLVLPNQQVTVREGQLEKETITRRKLVVAPQIGPPELAFDDQPVPDVLRTLAKIYGVTIVFDAKALAQCRITSSFNEETLPERLRIICQAIGATYTIENDCIRVVGQPCTLLIGSKPPLPMNQ